MISYRIMMFFERKSESIMKINNINIIYGREIIKNSDFITPDNGLVVIKGASGSGKTSLIKNIVLDEFNFDKYIVGEVELNDDNVDYIKKNHLSLMDQQNSFIEELTINDHISLSTNMYKNKDKYHLIEKLDLKQVLPKYPNQLSGGEKTRVSLVLCILKGSKVIVMDEPTSSIDSYYTQIVVDVLKKLADDHLVIVASHDEELFKSADYLYEIKDKVLILVKGTIENLEDIHDEKNKEIAKISLSKYMLMMKKYHLISNVVMTLLISLSIVLASVGLFYGINKINDSYVSFDEMYNSEIKAYKPLHKKTKSYYSANGLENYINDTEYDEILAIDGVKEITPHIELAYKTMNYTIDDSRRMNKGKFYFSLYNQGNLIKKITIDTNDADDPEVMAVSYDEKKDYSKFVENKYNDSGIYLTKEFAKLLGIDNIKKGTVLKFSLPVPLYKESGDMEISSGDSGQFVPGYPSLCTTIDVELPIAGVLQGLDMDLWSRMYPNAIFVPLDYYENLINKNLPKNSDTYYYIEEIWGFKRTVEANETVGETVNVTPWKPDTISIKLTSIEYYKDVSIKLEKLGYSIMSDVSFINTIDDYAYNISDTFIAFSLVLLLVMIMINFVLKFINRNCDYSLIKYFSNLGYSLKETKKVLSCRYLVNTILMIVVSFSYILVYFIYTNITHNFIIPIKYEYLLIIVILSFIIEYIFPKLFFRGDSK